MNAELPTGTGQCGEPAGGSSRAAERAAAALDELSSEALRRLHGYWAAKAPPNALPGRQHIDPLELGFILGNLILVDVLREPLRFRYRLVGTKLTAHYGFDPTGRMLEEHPEPTFRRVATYQYERVAHMGTPLAVRRDTVMDERVRRYEVLLLPLARDGTTVDMVMVGVCFL